MSVFPSEEQSHLLASKGDYLVFGSVPVVNQPCRDEEAVIHVADAAVIPPTVAAHLGFPIGQAYGALTAWRRKTGKSLGLYTTPEVHTQEAVRKVFPISETVFKFYLFLIT